MIKNKKGDIGITILVVLVIGVASLALLTFYSSTNNNVQKISSFVFVQDAYTYSDFISYSGKNLISKYPEVSLTDGSCRLTKEYSIESGLIFKSSTKSMTITYLFNCD